MSDRLIQLEKDLRSAVARRCYAEVDGATNAFCVQAAEDWQALPPGDPGTIRIFEHLMAVLEWSRLMLCTSRESTAAELRRCAPHQPVSDSCGRLRKPNALRYVAVRISRTAVKPLTRHPGDRFDLSPAAPNFSRSGCLPGNPNGTALAFNLAS